MPRVFFFCWLSIIIQVCRLAVLFLVVLQANIFVYKKWNIARLPVSSIILMIIQLTGKWAVLSRPNSAQTQSQSQTQTEANRSHENYPLMFGKFTEFEQWKKHSHEKCRKRIFLRSAHAKRSMVQSSLNLHPRWSWHPHNTDAWYVDVMVEKSVTINLFSPGVPAEGTCKHYIVLRRMANYNTRRKLPILPKMVWADS